MRPVVEENLDVRKKRSGQHVVHRAHQTATEGLGCEAKAGCASAGETERSVGEVAPVAISSCSDTPAMSLSAFIGSRIEAITYKITKFLC